MTKECLIFNEVLFFYDTCSLPIFDGLSVRLGVGWTGIIGPNGSGKTTFLRLACSEIEPLRGSVTSPDKVIYCPQRALKLRTKAKREVTKLNREITNRAEEAAKANRKRSKRGLSPKDHDARFVRGLAR